jgi:predicted transcriptional regulator
MQDNEKKIYLLDYINRNENIGQTEKNILFKLYMLDNENGCTASDYYLSKMHNLSPTHINKNLKKLEDKGFIQRSNVYVDSGKHRMIKVNVEKIKEPIVENDKTTYQNRQVPIVENDKTTYQNRQVPIVENDNTYTKENTKENTKEKTKERDSTLAFQFLKNNYSEDFKVKFIDKHNSSFKNKEDGKKFVDKFNNKMISDEVKFKPSILFAKLDSFAISWIDYEKKYNKVESKYEGRPWLKNVK